MNLTQLASALLADDLDASFVPAGSDADPDIDLDRVNVTLDIDGLDDPLIAQITDIDLAPGQFDGYRLMQIFVPYPEFLPAEVAEPFVAALPNINETVPVGAFNVQPDEKFIYYRNTMLVPDGDSAYGLIGQAIWMAYFSLEMLVPEFANVLGLVTTPDEGPDETAADTSDDGASN